MTGGRVSIVLDGKSQRFTSKMKRQVWVLLVRESVF